MSVPPPNLPLSSDPEPGKEIPKNSPPTLPPAPASPPSDAGTSSFKAPIASPTESTATPPQPQSPKKQEELNPFAGAASTPSSSPFMAVPGGGQDAPDPFAGTSSQSHSSTTPSTPQFTPSEDVPASLPGANVPPFAGNAATPPPQMADTPPLAPPAFQQPKPRSNGRKWIIIVVGIFVLVVLLGTIGFVVYSLFLGGQKDDVSGSIIVPTPSPRTSIQPSTSPTTSPSSSPSTSPSAEDKIDDPDKDGLTNAEEDFYGTNSDKEDTDGDGYSDGEEVRAGFDPLSEGKLDSDSDGFPDPDEREFGTDPFNPDTDGDGYKDGDEIQNGFNPLITSPGDQL